MISTRPNASVRRSKTLLRSIHSGPGIRYPLPVLSMFDLQIRRLHLISNPGVVGSDLAQLDLQPDLELRRLNHALEGGLTVLELRPFLARLSSRTRRMVDTPYARAGLILVLATFTARTEVLPLAVFGRDAERGSTAFSSSVHVPLDGFEPPTA